MRGYRKYKEWYELNLYYGEETKGFEEHINSMTLYELMEKISEWEYD